jgi:hypothetical protein
MMVWSPGFGRSLALDFSQLADDSETLLRSLDEMTRFP